MNDRRPLMVTEEQADLITRFLNRRARGGGNATVIDTPDQLTLSVPSQKITPAAPGLMMLQLRLQSEHEDYLICRSWDPVNEIVGATDIYVAKPYLLRQTPFGSPIVNRAGVSLTYTFTVNDDGVITRTVTDPDGSEIQLVVPEYNVAVEEGYLGDIIHAVPAVTGLTVEVEGDDVPITWLDLNIDGRTWHLDPSAGAE